jgi:hypothetical protein
MEIKIFDPGPGKTLHLYNASEEHLKRMKAPGLVHEIGKTRSGADDGRRQGGVCERAYTNLASEASR